VFWNPQRRRQRLAGIESEADRLILVMGAEAISVARRMEREANDFATMRYWASVQTIIARKTGEAVVFDRARQVGVFDPPPESGFRSEPSEPLRLSPPRAPDHDEDGLMPFANAGRRDDSRDVGPAFDPLSS
jgi:hypothetical protein